MSKTTNKHALSRTLSGAEGKAEGLIPELRFPEFVKEGDWVEKELGKMGDFLGGGTPSRTKIDYWVGSIPWISSSDISEDDIHNISITQFINRKAIDESATKIIPKGSILFVSRVGVGKLAINTKNELCTSQDFTNFIPTKVLNYFIAYYFSANKNYLQSLSQGTSIKGFSKSDLEVYKIFYPVNSKEQQKIASCLSSLDELLAAHNEKLQALKDHKKGLMQNLFPYPSASSVPGKSGGERSRTPNYRFPEFKNDGEWVEEKLGDVAENLDSKRIPITSNQREKGEIPYYGASGIIDFVKDYIYDEELLCISEDGANLVDRNYPIAFTIRGKTWVNNHAHVLKFENASTRILVEKYLNSINVEPFLTGAAQPKLNRGKLDIIPVPLPKNPKEQQKIASCLSAVDELITAQAELIEQLQQHKKGLMQGLFPKIEN